MEQLITATGRVFNVIHCGEMADLMDIIFSGHSREEVIRVFSDPNETHTLRYNTFPNEIVFTGFTEYVDYDGETLLLRKQ